MSRPDMSAIEREPSIPAELRSLEQALVSLESGVDVTCDRLVPVCRPERPSPPAAKGPAEPVEDVGPVASAIRQLTSRTLDTARRLQHMRDRLEV